MTTSTIYTTKDVSSSEINPTSNYGSSDKIYLDNTTNNKNYGHFGFDITSAPAVSTINSVLLYIFHYQYTGSSTGYFRRITGSWTESGLTWNNTPTVTDTNMVTATLPVNNTWGSYNITDIYKDAKTAGNELGVQIRQSSTTAIALASRENTYGAYDAYIFITYGITDYYVKTTGNDSLDGLSWTNAWATVNKAATTVPDGSTVHIGFGDYTLEPSANKIAPQNIGASGISYLPETATTGGGTGTVSVEQNT